MERRRFLTAAAVVTGVGLAGCSDPDDEDDGGGGGGYDLDQPTQPEPNPKLEQAATEEIQG